MANKKRIIFAMATEPTELRHLKRVSRIKHQVLTRYLPSWAVILGSTFDRLYFIDCFAGPGRYESDGELVDGSPVIAVKAGKEFATKNPARKLGIVLVDDDKAQLKQLEECLRSTLPYPPKLRGAHAAGRLAHPDSENRRTDKKDAAQRRAFSLLTPTVTRSRSRS